MDLEPVVRSQKEKNEYRVFSHKHEESRKKRYRWPYLQGRKRDADIDNGKSGGKAVGGMNWESSADVYTAPCGKQPASGEAALQYRGLRSGLCDDPEGCVGLRGRLKTEEIYVYLQRIHFILQQKQNSAKQFYSN